MLRHFERSPFLPPQLIIEQSEMSRPSPYRHVEAAVSAANRVHRRRHARRYRVNRAAD
jgi:hypothetical protein